MPLLNLAGSADATFGAYLCAAIAWPVLVVGLIIVVRVRWHRPSLANGMALVAALFLILGVGVAFAVMGALGSGIRG